MNIGRFDFPGGDAGILLLHGYTGATPEVRPMGEYLASKGLTVLAPLLPGHGTSVADLNTRSWREMADCAADGLYELQSRCTRVFVGGLSMGGLLTLHLGQRCPDIAGLIPMAAALHLRDPMRFLLPIARLFLESTAKGSDIHRSIVDPNSEKLMWSYDRNPVRFASEVIKLMNHVRRGLSTITQPLLIFQGAQDRQVSVSAAEAIALGTSSTDCQTIILPNSGHCLSIDGEREQVFAEAWRWIQLRS